MQTQTSCAPHLGDAANGCLSTCSARWLSRFPGKQSAPYVRLPLGRSRSWITREGRRVKAALRRASLGLDPPPFPRNTSSYDGQASLPSGNLRFPLTFTYHGRPRSFCSSISWVISPRCSDRACPIRRMVVRCPSDLFSIFSTCLVRRQDERTGRAIIRPACRRALGRQRLADCFTCLSEGGLRSWQVANLSTRSLTASQSWKLNDCTPVPAAVPFRAIWACS